MVCCFQTSSHERRELMPVPREIVKSKMPGVAFFLLNVTFISFIQSVLLFAISCVPAYAILLSSRFDPEITAADLAYFAVEVALVLSEFLSDGQQWSMSLPDVHTRCFLANTNPSLPGREAPVLQRCKAAQGLESGRPRSRIHHLRPVGLQQTPQLLR